MNGLAPPYRQRRLVGAVLVVFCSIGAGADAAGQNPFKKTFGGDKSVAYKLYKDPTCRFQIEYPEKELHPLPTGGSSLVVVSRNDGPAVFVDDVRLEEPFTPNHGPSHTHPTIR